MVLMKQATAAAVDGNALSMWRTGNLRLSNEIATVDKWGPLPPYAVLVNKNMSAETRDAVKSALLKMNEQEGWKEKLMRYSVVGFKEITPDIFQEEEEIKEYVQGMGLRDHVYY
ncbi:unnamed protein product [Cyprideis torosa]|uniref:Uncharacterized protein n=1 Tax=Cyprideis torosa TaxID=163714 RepID=A0A7R8WWY6_9CRUS|nr:unnamed protein product [Cyprideis torosa]CAG0908823.1 unnamed protein product [Cyprideis torosa]